MSPHPSAPLRRLTQQILRALVCPVCHAGLQLEAQSVGCTGCGRRYPVIDGVAVMLAERAI
jgi:hypothetical protein